MYSGPNGVVAERGYEHFGFSGSVPPGQTVTADYDFVVPEEHLGQLLVELSPTWDHDPSFFRGAL